MAEGRPILLPHRINMDPGTIPFPPPDFDGDADFPTTPGPCDPQIFSILNKVDALTAKVDALTVKIDALTTKVDAVAECVETGAPPSRVTNLEVGGSLTVRGSAVVHGSFVSYGSH